MRTRTTLVSFTQPFALNGIDGLLPAVSYRVDTDEETIDSLSRLAWRRVATTIEVQANGETEILTIGPGELDELLRRDNTEVARLVCVPAYCQLRFMEIDPTLVSTLASTTLSHRISLKIEIRLPALIFDSSGARGLL